MTFSITTRKIFITGALATLLVALQAFSPLWGSPTNNLPAEADKLHVVLLVAGHDAGIGNADMKDIGAMKRAILTAFAKDKNRVVFHDLTGINKKTNKVFSSAEILAYLRGMKFGTNDNVLVFHSGHGGITDRKRPEDSQILTVDGGQLQRKDIRSILLAKRPRALMILTDCCSSFIGTEEEEEMVPAPQAAAKLNVATVRNLLLRPIGIVSITAAQDGKEAIAASKGANPGNAGSAFTVALMRVWYKTTATYTTWEQMFPTLRTETFQASGGAHQARAFQISTNGVAAVK